MKITDILGQSLPVFKVGGSSVLPPPLFAVRAHLPHLAGFIRKVIVKDLDKKDLDKLNIHLWELWRGFDFEQLEAEELFSAVAEYIIFIQATVPNLPYCALPDITADEDEGNYSYAQNTTYEKLVADYANMTLPDVMKLNYVDFLILRREAYIYNLSKTKKGREKLEEAYCMEQTQPDRGGLRKQFGGGE